MTKQDKDTVYMEKIEINKRIREKRLNRTIEQNELINEKRRLKIANRSIAQKTIDSHKRKQKYTLNINLKIKDNLK